MGAQGWATPQDAPRRAAGMRARWRRRSIDHVAMGSPRAWLALRRISRLPPRLVDTDPRAMGSSSLWQTPCRRHQKGSDVVKCALWRL